MVCECVGGGKITHNAEEKTIEVGGKSQVRTCCDKCMVSVCNDSCFFRGHWEACLWDSGVHHFGIDCPELLIIIYRFLITAKISKRNLFHLYHRTSIQIGWIVVAQWQKVSPNRGSSGSIPFCYHFEASS